MKWKKIFLCLVTISFVYFLPLLDVGYSISSCCLLLSSRLGPHISLCRPSFRCSSTCFLILYSRMSVKSLYIWERKLVRLKSFKYLMLHFLWRRIASACSQVFRIWHCSRHLLNNCLSSLCNFDLLLFVAHLLNLHSVFSSLFFLVC